MSGGGQLISQLGYIGLEVSDMAGWITLARDILGVHVEEPDARGVVFLRVDEFAQRIALIPGPADDIVYSGWIAHDEAAFERAKTVLDERGIPWHMANEDERAARQVGAAILFEVGGLAMEIAFRPSVVWERPLRFGRPIAGFKTGAGGLGHIVVQTPEPDVVTDLFCNGFGFRVSDYIWEISFLRCNSRHHSLAVEPMEKGGKRLAHIMLELNRLDDVGSGWDLVRATETPFMKTIGKHVNDHMISFYLTTPSGFDIEYGHDGLLVDEASWQVQHHYVPSIWGHKRPAQM